MDKVSYNMGIATLSRGLIGFLSLIIVGILTRVLGPDGFGRYSTIFGYLYIFTAVADTGLYTIMIREISRISDKKEEQKIASKIFTLRLILAGAVLIIANALVFTMPYDMQVKLGVLVASIFSLGSLLVQVLVAIFQKYLRLYWVSIFDIVSRLVQLAIILVMVKLNASLIEFVLAVAISEIIHFVLIFIFSQKLVKIKLTIDLGYFKETLKTAIPIAISLVLVLIYFKLDTVLLSIMKPAHDVGVYSAAYKVLEMAIFLPAIYIGLIMPGLSRNAIKNTLEFLRIFRDAFNIISIFAFYFLVYVFLMSDWIIYFIGGDNFSSASHVLKILSLAMFLIFFGNLGGNAIIALNRQKKAMFIYLVGAVANVFLNIILIPKYSYFATAGVTLLTEALIIYGMYWLLRKELRSVIGKSVFSKCLLAALIAGIVTMPLLDSFILASLMSLAYFPLLVILGVFKIQDLKKIIFLKNQENTMVAETNTVL